MASYCIDDFRRRYGDGTKAEEFQAQMRFLETMDEEGRFYESSGARLVAQDALDLFVENHYVIVVDTPEDVCVSHIRGGGGSTTTYRSRSLVPATITFIEPMISSDRGHSADGASIFPYCGWTGCCLWRNR